MTDTTPHRATVEELRARVDALEGSYETMRLAALAWGKDVKKLMRWSDQHLQRIEALEAGATCPHIVTSDEGTSYCGLAEQQAAPAAPAPDHDLANAAPLLWVLWNHLGGKSPVGQPIRQYLKMGQFERMTADQIQAAEQWAEQRANWKPMATTEQSSAASPEPAPAGSLQVVRLAYGDCIGGVDAVMGSEWRGLAAALRALADQVVPEIVAEEWRYSPLLRAEILAIAAELEGGR